MIESILYKTAIYCRLSLDDGSLGESGSIQTQKMMLEKYCRDNNFTIKEVYIDDGYSGLNFDRPAFKRLIADIESGKINLVITKDLSRLGRDYLQTGYYTEQYFPLHNVRYIAVNDGVDTLIDNNDIAPFKNILNDMYAKDLSRKVKSAKRQRALNGLFISAQTPYGYIKDPTNKNHLIVDEDVRHVIELIFNMCVNGKGAPTIAKVLEEKGILNPAASKNSLIVGAKIDGGVVVGGAKISGLAALGIGAGGAFVTGGLGYIARTLISDCETFELSDMFIEAGANMLSGMTTFAGSIIGGLIGVKVPGKFSFKNFVLNQMFMGFSGFYLLKYTISLLKKKLQEIY